MGNIDSQAFFRASSDQEGDKLAVRLKKPAQYDAVIKVFRSMFGGEHQEAFSLLALYICKEDCPEPLPEILLKLFRDGCSVTRLLAALLRCESLRMQALFTGHSKMPLHAQFEDLRTMVHDFNGLQDAVMEVGEIYLAETEAKTIRSLDIDEEVDDSCGRIAGYMGMSNEEIEQHCRNVLLASRIEWTKTGRVRLFNVFRGLPVTASVDVVGSDESVIQIRMDRDVGKVFASHPLQSRAYLACAGGEDQVHVSIQEVGKTLTLSLEDVSPSFMDRRGDLGVQITDDIPVEIMMHGRKIGMVHLYDASVTGLGFVLRQKDQTPYNAGDEIECCFMLGSRDFKVSGWIRWLQAHEGGTRIGMELKSDKAIQQALQREIFRIQREIIVAMNELDMPAAFEPFL